MKEDDETLYSFGTTDADQRADVSDFYQSKQWKWVQNIRWETWDTFPGGLNYAMGQNSAAYLTTGGMNFLFGPGIGSLITTERGKVIVALPNNRLFKADLIAETAEFMDYSDDAACVAPKFREKGH